MKLDKYEFEGPYSDPDSIKDEAGIYVVLSISEGSSPMVLDVETSGEGIWPSSQGMRRRLRSHERRPCWKKHRGKGKLVFAVIYIHDQKERLRVEDQLRKILNPPCGTMLPE